MACWLGCTTWKKHTDLAVASSRWCHSVSITSQQSHIHLLVWEMPATSTSALNRRMWKGETKENTLHTISQKMRGNFLVSYKTPRFDALVNGGVEDSGRFCCHPSWPQGERESERERELKLAFVDTRPAMLSFAGFCFCLYCFEYLRHVL